MKNLKLFDFVISLTFGMILTFSLQYIQKNNFYKVKPKMNLAKYKTDSINSFNNVTSKKTHATRQIASIDSSEFVELNPISYVNHSMDTNQSDLKSIENEFSDEYNERRVNELSETERLLADQMNKKTEDYLIREMNISLGDVAVISDAKTAMEEQINQYKQSQADMPYDGSINDFNINSYKEYQKTLFQILGPERLKKFSHWTSIQEAAIAQMRIDR